MSKPSKETTIRTVLLIIALVNNALALFGKSPIPISDDTVVDIVSFLFTAGTAIATWWYNNSFTLPAQLADECLKTFKQREKDEKKENDITCEE